MSEKSATGESFPQGFGPFTLLRLLGTGGMGSAYLASHPDSPVLLVVKRLHPELLRQKQTFKRFLHEAEVAAHVRHLNVAALVAMGTIDREPFLAMEHVFGVSLSQVIDRVEQAVIDPVPLDIALALGLEIARGLVGIHSTRHLENGAPLELVHRDVSSRNILVGFDGVVRIIDLGLGKSALADWQTAHKMVAGSPDYMPPEQALGERVGVGADVYAAAVAIWELLVGRKRIREDTIPARLKRAARAVPEPLLRYRPDASPALEQLLQAAMAPDPSQRIRSADALAEGLREALTEIRTDLARQHVTGWLDTACATLIAKEKRALASAMALIATRPTPSPSKTKYWVQRAGGFSKPPPDPGHLYVGLEPGTTPTHMDSRGALSPGYGGYGWSLNLGRTLERIKAKMARALRKAFGEADGNKVMADVSIPSTLLSPAAARRKRAGRAFVLAGVAAVAVSIGFVARSGLRPGPAVDMAERSEPSGPTSSSRTDPSKAKAPQSAPEGETAGRSTRSSPAQAPAEAPAQAPAEPAARSAARETSASASERTQGPAAGQTAHSKRGSEPSGRAPASPVARSAVRAEDAGERASSSALRPTPERLAKTTHRKSSASPSKEKELRGKRPRSTTPNSLAKDFVARREALVRRVRELRRIRFDRPWQDTMTELSARISRARDEAALDAAAAQLEELATK